MKRINLMPADIAGERLSSHVLLGRWLPGIAVASVILVWVLVIVLHARQLNARIEREMHLLVDARANVQNDPAAEQSINIRLLPNMNPEVLREPLPPQAILALLSQQIPEGVVLHHLEIDIPRTDQDHRSKGKKLSAIMIRLSGQASSDALIPTLINHLSSTGVLHQIVLTENDRVVELGEMSWRFVLTMQIVLEEVPYDSAQEVACAD